MTKTTLPQQVVYLVCTLALACEVDNTTPASGPRDSGMANDGTRDVNQGGHAQDDANQGGHRPGDASVGGGGMGGADATVAVEDSATPSGPSPLTRVVGGYYPNWTPDPVRVRDVHPAYNVIYLFAARPVGGPPGTTGAVEFTMPGDGRGASTHFKEDLAYARTEQGRKIILSVGGAGQGMSFPTREKSQAFVNSVVALYEQLGGFDGLDWNTFEADQDPDTEEMIWMSLEFKNRFPGFIITAPPAPWNQRDQNFCKAMVEAGALDYAAPQYYDGPNLNEHDYIVSNVSLWASLLGEEHLVVGFGVWDATYYWSISEAVTAWRALEATHPNLRGSFNWQIHTDEANNWAFAEQLAPLVLDGP